MIIRKDKKFFIFFPNFLGLTDTQSPNQKVESPMVSTPPNLQDMVQSPFTPIEPQPLPQLQPQPLMMTSSDRLPDVLTTHWLSSTSILGHVSNLLLVIIWLKKLVSSNCFYV
jgi:hypothetical protein